MQHQRKSRRPYGTGSLHEKAGAWYGRWRVGDRRVNRKLGPVRQPGTRVGLTRTQAERELRRHIENDVVAASAPVLRTLGDAAREYLHHLEYVMERKPSTVQDYGIMVARHLEPYFAGRDLERVTPDHVAAYMTAKRRAGLATNTILHQLNFLHAVFKYAAKRRWVAVNPVDYVDRPRAPGANPDIRFLTLAELEALIRAVPNDVLGATDRVVYLAAAMTGMRQGELIALRWRDIDWAASRVRVRQNLVRGRYGTPKSKRSSRGVPLADRLAGELERHFQRSVYQGDDDPVFCHPETGKPYDPSRMRKRFYRAMRAAGMSHMIGQQNGITFHSLRHSFGTQMAAAGVPMRTLQEWMGHRDSKTTEIYADYQPDQRREAELVERAFDRGSNLGTNLSESDSNSPQLNPL